MKVRMPAPTWVDQRYGSPSCRSLWTPRSVSWKFSLVKSAEGSDWTPSGAWLPKPPDTPLVTGWSQSIAPGQKEVRTTLEGSVLRCLALCCNVLQVCTRSGVRVRRWHPNPLNTISLLMCFQRVHQDIHRNVRLQHGPRSKRDR